MALNTLQNFFKATVTTNWATGTGNRYISALPTPTSGRLVINPSNISKREIVEYSAKGTDAGGNYITISARGVGGTTDQAHSVNESVRMNFTAQDYAAIQTELDLKLPTSYLDTDGTLAANSDTKIASQKATKTYSDTKVSKTGNETVAGIKTFSSSPIVPTPTNSTDAVTKAYADGLAIAGSPNASTTAKGIVEESTQAEIEAQTAAGSTGARLFINPSTWFSAFKNMFTVIETTSLPYSLTTTAGQRVIVFARATFGSTGGSGVAFNLTYNGVTKDTVTVNIGGPSDSQEYSLMYTEIPGAATANVTLSGGSSQKLIIIKF